MTRSDFSFWSAEAPSEEGRSGCWQTLQGLLPDPRRDNRTTWEARGVSSERASSLTSPLLFVKKTCLWSELRIKKGVIQSLSGEIQSLQCRCNSGRERKRACLAKEEVGLCGHIALGFIVIPGAPQVGWECVCVCVCQTAVKTRLPLISCSANLSSPHNYKGEKTYHI